MHETLTPIARQRYILTVDLFADNRHKLTAMNTMTPDMNPTHRAFVTPYWAARLLAACALILLVAPLAHGAELVAEFKGDRSKQTGEFEVDAPWILDWRVTGEYAREMGIDVSLIEAGTYVHQGNVLKTKNPGNGVRLFNEGGKFFFRVDSTLSGWTLKVEQLTREEAELYTPRSQNALDY